MRSPSGWVEPGQRPDFDEYTVVLKGALHVEPFYVVMGFAATKYGLSVLGRASQKQVVNVAQRGGLCAVMVGHSVAPLVDPDARAVK